MQGCGQRLKGWIRGSISTQSPSDLEFYNRSNLDGENIHVLKGKTRTKPCTPIWPDTSGLSFPLFSFLAGMLVVSSGFTQFLDCGEGCFCLLRKHLH